jgi:hypothetical protein
MIAMVRNLLTALSSRKTLQHVAMVTGLKHYLGPFEAYASSGTPPGTPLCEAQPRSPIESKETGRPFRFPESEAQRKGLSGVTDARSLAMPLLWAADTGAAQAPELAMANDNALWRQMALRHGPVEADLGCPIEVMTDRTKSRKLEFQRTRRLIP